MEDNDLLIVLAKIQEKLERIDTLLRGDGEEKLGLVLRVDRLEKVGQSRAWFDRAITTGIIGLAGEVLYKHLIGK